MNNSAGVLSERPITPMEQMVKSVSGTTEAINAANEKLRDILQRLRGSLPSPDSPGEKYPEPNGSHLSQLEFQMRNQTIGLNYIHNQIDELARLI